MVEIILIEFNCFSLSGGANHKESQKCFQLWHKHNSPRLTINHSQLEKFLIDFYSYFKIKLKAITASNKIPDAILANNI